MTLLSFVRDPAAAAAVPRHRGREPQRGARSRRAAWLFPLYLVLINLFVVPIAIAGLLTFPAGSVDSDMFVLALPLLGRIRRADARSPSSAACRPRPPW